MKKNRALVMGMIAIVLGIVFTLCSILGFIFEARVSADLQKRYGVNAADLAGQISKELSLTSVDQLLITAMTEDMAYTSIQSSKQVQDELGLIGMMSLRSNKIFLLIVGCVLIVSGLLVRFAIGKRSCANNSGYDMTMSKMFYIFVSTFGSVSLITSLWKFISVRSSGLTAEQISNALTPYLTKGIGIGTRMNIVYTYNCVNLLWISLLITAAAITLYFLCKKQEAM